MSSQHYLVGLEELGVRIGFAPSVRKESIVDVFAKSEEEAIGKAKTRYAKKFHTNPICLRVVEVQAVPKPMKTKPLKASDFPPTPLGQLLSWEVPSSWSWKIRSA